SLICNYCEKTDSIITPEACCTVCKKLNEDILIRNLIYSSPSSFDEEYQKQDNENDDLRVGENH
ncbi:MAG TPA: hypothetical protein VN457_01620, partial [Chlamydiales bacterium]|nr:hypothetical protein [Chlamydiales bacterium]